MGIHFSNSNHPELENCCRNSTTVSHLVIVSHSDTYPHSKIILNTLKSSLIHCHHPTLQNHWNPLSYILLRLSQILWSSVIVSLDSCHIQNPRWTVSYSLTPFKDSRSAVIELQINCHRFTDQLLQNPWSTVTDSLINCHRFTDQLS